MLHLRCGFYRVGGINKDRQSLDRVEQTDPTIRYGKVFMGCGHPLDDIALSRRLEGLLNLQLPCGNQQARLRRSEIVFLQRDLVDPSVRFPLITSVVPSIAPLFHEHNCHVFNPRGTASSPPQPRIAHCNKG
jgi:hypothetical protein